MAIGAWSEAGLVAFLFSLGTVLQTATLERTRRAISGLMDLTPPVATVIRDGAEVVVPAAEVMEAAMKMAEELNALPPLAVRWTKLSVNKWIKHQLNLILDASIAYEMLSINSRDHHEAAKAFIEKRPPKWAGR